MCFVESIELLNTYKKSQFAEQVKYFVIRDTNKWRQHKLTGLEAIELVR